MSTAEHSTGQSGHSIQRFEHKEISDQSFTEKSFKVIVNQYCDLFLSEGGYLA